MTTNTTPTPSALFVVWQMGFRSFFLGGATYALLFMLYWTSGLHGFTPLGSGLNTIFFHVHELVYGFAGAIIAGFLLTASANWTGTRGLHGLPLQILFGLWLVGRLGMWAALLGMGRGWVLMAALFLPALIIGITPTLWRGGKWNNTALVGWLSLMSIGQMFYLLETSGIAMGWGRRGLYLGLNCVLFLLVMIGGRVVPYFTKNALQAPDIDKWPLMDRAGLFGVIAYTISMLVWDQSHPITSAAALFAGAANLVRMWTWGSWRTRTKPILWILHLAYLWIVIGFFLHSLSIWTRVIHPSTYIHAFTVGGIGCFVLGMISRVSLGHTGRPLLVAPSIVLAYALVLSAACLRVITPFFPSTWVHVLLLFTGGCWIVAYTLFLVQYTPILLAPRPDGRAG